MIYFAVPLQDLFYLAYNARHLLSCFGEAFLLMLKVFAGIEVGFVLLLAVIVAVSRVGRSETKSRQPLLRTETPSH